MKNIIHTEIVKIILCHKTLGDESLKYVNKIEDTEKYFKIGYAFDIKLQKGNIYDISYVTKAKEYNDSSGMKDIEEQTIYAGECRYVCTERVLSNDCLTSYRFIFKKVKNK